MPTFCITEKKKERKFMSKRIKELHAAFSNVFAFIYPLRLTNKDNGNFFTPVAQAALTYNEAQKANNFIW